MIFERLRVALITGGLGLGGAEKQLVYIARALLNTGAEVRVYSLTQGEFFETNLIELGLQPVWIGRFNNPLVRSLHLTNILRDYQPQIIQSSHFFMNLYAVVASRLLGSICVGTVRSDISYDVDGNGFWGAWLLRTPSALVVNSQKAQKNAGLWGISSEKIHLLPNVIDLNEFDHFRPATDMKLKAKDGFLVFAVGSLLPDKRVDRFLTALADARQKSPEIKGIIIGDGPEKNNLLTAAADQGLFPEGLLFLGSSRDVPALLRQADALMLASDHEGFPNVLIEAMAARLPVLTTPAGDAGIIVQDGISGFVIPFEDIGRMSESLIQLEKSPELRRRMGDAGRRRVETHYSFDSLASRLIGIYTEIANRQSEIRLLKILESMSGG